MALVVQSVASTDFPASGTATTVVVTKPTGLSVGDYMLAIVCVAGETAAPTITPPADWSTIEASAEAGNNNVIMAVYGKTADADDAAASDFTFTSGTATTLSAGIYRISGQAPGHEVLDSTFVECTGTTTKSGTCAITPLVANSLVVTAFSSLINSTGSNYTVTPSVTMTEGWDHGESSPDSSFCSAYGVYTGNSEITAFAYDQSSTATTSGIIIVLSPLTNASGTVALLVPNVTHFAGTASVGTSGTVALLSPNVTHQSQSGKVTSPTQWTPASKPSETPWTPISK